jgi:hypothetical protein
MSEGESGPLMRTFSAMLLLGFILIGMSSVSAQSRVSNFGLKNQNDQYTEVNFPSDRPVILIFGDRKGSEQIAGWSKPLYDSYGNKVYIFGIASLGGVPSYARGLVRRLIKRQTSYPVLLDWGGKIADGLGYEKGKAFVVVVSKDGSVRAKHSGPANETSLNTIKAELNKQF